MYLSKLAGENTTLPIEPLTREEMYLEGAIGRVEAVEEEVEELKNNPDVADIVATYADLQAYDTSKLTDKDVIRVLADETHSGDSTYYRFSKQSGTFTYIGESKQYTDFVGTDGTSAGTAGLVPAPAATDAGKYLKADGTWDSVQAGPTVVQTTGTSQTDVMSQNAVTSALFNDPSTGHNISIGNSSAGSSAVSIGQSAYGAGSQSVAIGLDANTYAGDDAVAIGTQARARRNGAVAIGYYANNGTDGVRGSVSIGSYSKATSQGEMNIGTSDTSYGYNNTNYRLLSGVHDGSNAHDAVTVGQLDGRVLQNAGAPTTATVGTLGQLLEDTTNAKLYQCTAVTGDGGDPEVFTYTWTEVGAGGGGGSAIKTLTSADANWPENNPTDIALWKLEPGIYKKGDNTSIWFCNGTDRSTANSSVIVNWTGYQTMFIVGLPVLWNGGPTTGKTLMAFAGATAGDGLTSSYPCLEWAVWDNGNNQGNASTTIRYVKENELRAQSGATAPTTSTSPRYLGDLYIDTTNQDCYVNVKVYTGNNVWKKITP